MKVFHFALIYNAVAYRKMTVAIANIKVI